jgi:hypothetical protein
VRRCRRAAAANILLFRCAEWIDDINDRIREVFTSPANIPERPLIGVFYNFQTSAVISDVVQSTFEQYGFPCDESRRGYKPLCYPAPKDKGDWLVANLLFDPPYQKYKLNADDDALTGPPGLWLRLECYWLR